MASSSSSNLSDSLLTPVKKVQFANLNSAITSGSVFTRVLCTSICVGYLLSFSHALLDLLTVSPGKLVPPNFWIWTLVTYTSVEIHWWLLMSDVLAIIVFGKYIEPLWSVIESLRFYFVVTVLSAILSVTTYLLLYLPIQDTNLLFSNHLCGISAFVAAVAVAYRQTAPEAIPLSLPVGKLRSRHITCWLVVLVVVGQLIGIVEHSYVVLFLWGTIVSWIYLRFYQPHSNGSRGDMAESFTFAGFFPDAIQPFVAVLSNTVYAALVSIRVCKKVTKRYDITPQPLVVSLPGTDVQDAERRRQLALKALNERLSRAPAAPTWPSLDDDSESTLPPVPVGTTPVAFEPVPQQTNSHVSSSSFPASPSEDT